MTEAADGTVTWSELVAETETRLREAGVDGDPRVQARWIVEEATGTGGDDYAEIVGRAATVRGVALLDEMVGRRVNGEPIQYVLGRWAFRHLDLFVDRRVLIPRPETEIVVDHALRELDRSRASGAGTVVDLGTGSGAIGLSVVRERPGTRVVLTDASADALAVARANLAGLGIIGGTVEISQGDWYEALSVDLVEACDVIVANPPYVRDGAILSESVSAWEPASALFAGRDGLDDLRVLVRGVRRWLRRSGAIVVELDPAQADEVTAIAADEGLTTEVHRDLAGLVRVMVARAEP